MEIMASKMKFSHVVIVDNANDGVDDVDELSTVTL